MNIHHYFQKLLGLMPSGRFVDCFPSMLLSDQNLNGQLLSCFHEMNDGEGLLNLLFLRMGRTMQT